MTFDFGSINWLAVLVAAVAGFLVGGIWYGALFARKWVAVHGFSADEEAAMAKVQGRNFAIFFVGDLVLGTVASLLVINLGITGFAGGIVLGLLIWLGFLATHASAKMAAYNKSLQAFVLETGHDLISLVVMCGIIAAWR